MDVPWIVFLLGALIGLYPSVDLSLSVERLFGILAGIALYYMIVNSSTKGYLKFFLSLYLVSVLLFALLGLKQIPIEAFERSRLLALIEVVRAIIPAITTYDLSPNTLAGAIIVPFPSR